MMRKASLATATGVLGFFIALGGAAAVWKQFDLPSPAMEEDLEEVERKHIQLAGDVVQNRLDILSDRLDRANAKRYQNLNVGESYRQKGESLPPWLLDERTQIDRDIREIEQEIRLLESKRVN